MTNTFRPLLSRIVAPFIGALVVWLSTRYGLELPGVAEALTELIVFAVTTGVSHKLIDRYVNPLDAAKVPEGPAVVEAAQTGSAAP